MRVRLQKTKKVTNQGKMQVSVLVLTAKDIEENPKLPIHIYDLEVQVTLATCVRLRLSLINPCFEWKMWAEMEQKKEVNDFSLDGKYLQNNVNCALRTAAG